MKIKKLGKILGIITASMFLFFIIAILSLNSFLKSEKGKQLVIGRIESLLNMPVEMQHFRTNIFSGVQLDGFSIKNPQGFPEGYSLKTETIILKYNFYDLLHRKFKIEEIQVVHPDIHLVQKADGTWNFPLITVESPSIPHEKKKIIPLVADNVQIIGGNLTYMKLGEDRNISLQNFTLKAKIHSINSFPDMNLNLSIAGIESSVMPTIEDIKGSIKTSKDRAYLDNVSLHFSGGSIAIEGNTTIPVDNKEAEYTATISVKDIDLQMLLSQFLPDAKNLLKGILSADINIKGQGLNATTDINLTIPSLTVQDRIKIDQIKSSIYYANPNFSIQALNMNVLGGSVEGKGNGTLADITNPAFNVNLNLNNIDASTALTALGKDSSLAQGKLTGNINATGNIFNIKADGKISSGKLNLKKIGDITDVSAPFKATVTQQNKEINIENFSAKIYGGSINGNANITFGKDEEPKFSTTMNLSSIEAKDALKELTGKTFITGKGEGNIKLQGRGNDINALTGSTDFTFRDGKISSHPIQNLLALVLQMPSLTTINFVSAQVSSTIEDGEINIKKVHIEDPKLIKFDSKGDIKISNQKLSLPSHLSLNCNMVEKMQLISEAFTKEDDKWCGIDFKISGTLSDPKENLQDKLKKQAVKGILEQFLDKEQKKND